MKKVFAVAVVAVLIAGSSALGQINLQFENWDLNLNNHINLGVGGVGPIDASTTQGIGTLSMQNMGINPDENGIPLHFATQGIAAALFQDGTVDTDGAHASLDQTLDVEGVGISVNGQPLAAGQTQMVGNLAGGVLQYEGVKVDGGQDLAKSSGSVATVDGLNLTAFGMGQTAANNCADGCQLSVIIGGQYSELNGASQGAGTVATGMTAVVQQLQMANQPPAPVEP